MLIYLIDVCHMEILFKKIINYKDDDILWFQRKYSKPNYITINNAPPKKIYAEISSIDRYGRNVIWYRKHN